MIFPAFKLDLVQQLDAGLWALSVEIGIFLLLALILHWRNVRHILTIALPKGGHVNALCYVLEILLLTPLLGLLILWLHQKIQWSPLGLGTVWASFPAWLSLLLVLVIADGVSYFRHRFEHTRWLWPIHAMHHSDREMSWFTLYRQHPLNRATAVMIDIGVLLSLGIPLWALFANAWIRHYYGLFTHANVPWTLGPLGRVLVSPAMHRWHHVREGEGVGKNFATVFSIFDQLFGTYYVPSPCSSPVGLNTPGYASFFGQISAPVKLAIRRLRRGRAAGVA